MLIILMSGSMHAAQDESWWWPFSSNVGTFNSNVMSWSTIMLDVNTNLKEFGGTLINMAKDNDCHGILLVIDNNGGSAGLYSTLHDTICSIKKRKPVVALVIGNACSAAYWVASAADYIIAHSACSIGNIGVYQEIERWKDVSVTRGEYKALVAKTYMIKAGKYKNLYNPSASDLSEDQITYIEEEVKKLYLEFIKTVARNRNLDVARHNEWADGKTFLPSEALQLGLIDEIGTIFEAEAKLIELMNKKHARR